MRPAGNALVAIGLRPDSPTSPKREAGVSGTKHTSWSRYAEEAVQASAKWWVLSSNRRRSTASGGHRRDPRRVPSRTHGRKSTDGLDQSVLSELLDAFRSGEGRDLIRGAVRHGCKALIEAELTSVIGAERYARGVETRTAERNGHRPRVLATKADDVELAIPKLRKRAASILDPRASASYRPEPFYRGGDGGHVQGVSTRAVDDLVGALRSPGSGISRRGGLLASALASTRWSRIVPLELAKVLGRAPCRSASPNVTEPTR